jgi:hypothetical protein
MDRDRSRPNWRNPSAFPRLGFLLFILAIAIVAWPKIKSMQLADAPIVTIPEESGAADSNLGESMETQSHQIASNLDELTPSENSEPTNSEDSKNLILDEQTKSLLSLVSDNALRMAKLEMPAYWELVKRSVNSSYETMRSASKSGYKFNDFYSHPASHRGELVELEITVRRVTRYPSETNNPAGVGGVYEVWGSTEQSHAWLYVLVTAELPSGFSEESMLKRKAKFVGYFMKILAYQPGNAFPNAKPLAAPMFIGRYFRLDRRRRDRRSERNRQTKGNEDLSWMNLE